MQRELEADHEFIVNRLAKLTDSASTALNGSITGLLSPPLTMASTPSCAPSTVQVTELDKLPHSRSHSLDELKSGLLMDSLYTQLAVMHAKHSQRETQRINHVFLYRDNSAENNR